MVKIAPSAGGQEPSVYTGARMLQLVVRRSERLLSTQS